MKTRKSFILLIALALFPASVLSAASYSLSDGSPLEGKISAIRGDQVTITLKSGEKATHGLSAFDAASQESIQTFGKKHPEVVDVHTRFDKQPVIKSSSKPILPDQFRNRSFKGMVSVDLVLDESGKVISATIQKSTHPELEEPTIKAAKAWRFQPAVVDGKKVKAKLRVPFKFSGEA